MEKNKSKQKRSGIKDCPFCGSSNIKINHSKSVGWWVSCSKCNSCGGWDNDARKKSIENWNKRMKTTTMYGEDVVGDCEGCGKIFLDHDEYETDNHGVTLCRTCMKELMDSKS